MLTQREQDNIWDHHQNQSRAIFDLSYPRLVYLARKCAAGERVLTIGVGSGYLEEILVQRRVDLYSLDPSTATIDRLRKDLGMDARAQQGYGQSIPFSADFFDRVIMTEVLEHLPTDILHRTLDEVRRVLKPGGQFIGTVPYREDLDLNVVVCPHCSSTFRRWGHEQTFDRVSLTKLLAQHSFEIGRVYPRAFADFRRWRPRPLLRAVFRHVLGLMGEPVVGPNLYFSVAKALNVRAQ
jgi:SAM-dependent methyltransferase